MNKAQVSKIASPVIAAIVAAEKSQTKVGDAVLAAAASLKEADIKPFCEAVKASLEKRGFTPNSTKVTVMYIRRVLTAIIVDGLKPEPGQTLRSLYDALPKKATGGAAHAPRLPNPGEEKPAAPATNTAERFKDAITVLFGYTEPDLIAAVQYATENAGLFIRWALASAQAQQMAEIEKAVAAKPAIKRARKAAATA